MPNHFNNWISHAIIVVCLITSYGCFNKSTAPNLSHEESFSSGSLTVTVGIEKQTLIIADPIKVHLWVSVPKGFSMKEKIPKIKSLSQSLNIQQSIVDKPIMINGVRTLHISYTIISNIMGSFEIPPIKIAIHSIEENDIFHEVATRPMELTIKSILSEEMKGQTEIVDPLLPKFKLEKPPSHNELTKKLNSETHNSIDPESVE